MKFWKDLLVATSHLTNRPEYLEQAEFLAIIQAAKEEAEGLSRAADAISGKSSTGGAT
ncbi:hypothetical protein ACIPY0_07325 [Paenarthrobacter nicotinovorans]|uniref:hypothetical protein n=1 Tax=Paenarthrobacter nicotinovorans TaxID=29320 RepID=UPI00381E45C9